MGLILQDAPLIIPAGIVDLASFRRWTLSDEFPQRGRIDYIHGQIEVDISPANIWRHSGLKSILGMDIGALIRSQNLGQVFIDQTRVVSPVADLSCEPDILYVSWESLKSGRVVCRPAAKPSDALDQMEFEGGPELVVEVVSPSSVAKDTQRLPPAYFSAGVREFWLADARVQEAKLIIHARGRAGFEPVVIDAQGYQRSEVLGELFKLTCKPGPVANTLVFNATQTISFCELSEHAEFHARRTIQGTP